MPKRIIFDFDGTLVDSRALIVKLYNEMAFEHRFRRIEDEDLALLRALPAAERLKRLGVPVLQISKLAVAGRRRYQENICTLDLIPGMREALDKLSANGLESSILSSNSIDILRLFLKNNKLEGFFKEIVSAKSTFGKQRSIRKVIQQCRASSSQIIYVGDELRDVEACKKLGIPVIAVTWGFDSSELLRSGNPDYIAESPKELLNILLTLA